jgi:hypothetical protein
MLSEEVAEFYKELREADAMLRDLKRGTKELVREYDMDAVPNGKKKAGDYPSTEHRCLSGSAWARSTTKKEYPLTKSGGDSSAPTSDIDPSRSDRYVRTRTPQYTFGMRPSTPSGQLTRNEDHFSGDYDVNMNSLSTRKRSRVSTISKTARIDPLGYEHGRVVSRVTEESEKGEQQPNRTEADNAGTIDDQVDSASSVGDGPEARQHTEDRPLPGKSYSFGKGQRFVQHVKLAAQSEASIESAVLDVEAATRALEPRTTTAVMGPRPSTAGARLTNSSAPALSSVDPSPAATSPSKMNISALAYRPRTPNVTSMHPESKFDKSKVTGDVNLGLPGPGYYNVKDGAAAKPVKSHSKPVGVVYYSESQPKKPAALNAKVHVEQESKAAVGPGTYAVDKSYSYVSHRQPVLAIVRDADSKPTPHMQRKSYFEQKARDMREAHDNLREANISQVTSRTPTVLLAPPKWSEKDPRREKILQEHRLANMPSDSVSNRTRSRVKVGDVVLGKSFDDLDMPRRSANSSTLSSQERLFRGVEKRVPTGAFMRAEVTARRSTSAMRQARPGVIQRYYCHCEVSFVRGVPSFIQFVVPLYIQVGGGKGGACSSAALLRSAAAGPVGQRHSRHGS